MLHRRKHVKCYGAVWDESQSSPTLERIGQGKSSPAAAKLPDNLMALQSRMRSCLLSDTGAVQYYTGATDRTKKEDMVTSSVLTGADGQVMVEIPLGWLKYWYADSKHHYLISKEQFNGASRLDAFHKNDEWVKNRYIGAYEGIGYDHGTTSYFDGDDEGNDPTTNWPGGTAIDLANDKLGSVSGFAPLVNETRAEFRSISKNRGTGWRQQDYDLVSAIQLLYLVEYADWNSQSMIGMGRTELTGGSWAKDSYIGVTGKSNSEGNASASVGGDTNDAYMSYRGIENFYGNVWKWVDGININSNVPYVCNNDTQFADDTTTNYTALSVTLASSNDYQKTLEQIARGFLPASVGGSSSTYITDYYYQDSGWRTALLGSVSSNSTLAGVAYWNMYHFSADDGFNFNGRLSY